MKEHNLRTGTVDDPSTLTIEVCARCVRCGVKHVEYINMNIVGSHDDLVELATEQAVKHLIEEWTEDCDEAARLRQVRAVHDS